MSSDRPLIAVTTSELREASVATQLDEADPPRREMVLGVAYLTAISSHGGTPIVVPPFSDEVVDSLLDRVDGVCLSGGPDIHPSAFGADPHAELGPTEPSLDAFELALARAADERAMPIFAICRGCQVLNVARGGTLHQHLPDVVGTDIEHRQPQAGHVVTHDVSVKAGTRLASMLGGHTAQVNSFHHQAAFGLGGGLVATAWAPDGTVEAFEDPDRPHVVGVQWHAESLTRRPEHGELFTQFIDACRPLRAAAAA